MEISLTKNVERKKIGQIYGRINRRVRVLNPMIQLDIVYLCAKYEHFILNGSGDIFDKKVLRNYGKMDGRNERCKPVYPHFFKGGV